MICTLFAVQLGIHLEQISGLKDEKRIGAFSGSGYQCDKVGECVLYMRDASCMAGIQR